APAACRPAHWRREGPRAASAAGAIRTRTAVAAQDVVRARAAGSGVGGPVFAPPAWQSGHPRTAAKLGNPATLVVSAPAQGLQKRMWAVEFPTARRGSGGNARTGSVASRRACGRDGAWLAADAGSGRETRRRPGRGGCRAGRAG